MNEASAHGVSQLSTDLVQTEALTRDFFSREAPAHTITSK
jgi:hypothetical protein